METNREEETFSLASAMQHTESMRQEVRHLKTRTLIALLVSSFVLVTWFGAVNGVRYGFIPTVFYRYVLSAPAAFNMLAWLFWVVTSASSLYRSSAPRRISPEDLDKSFLIKQYEATQYLYRRQSRRAAMIEVALAGQFIFMGVHAAASLFSFFPF